MKELSLDISFTSPLHKRIIEFVNARYSFASRRMSGLHDKWRKNEDQFVAFAPERNVDAARRSLRENSGKPQYTTIVLPYTYAMLMSAHSYWTTVFLARDPIFQYAGRHGEGEIQTQALEAMIAYQVQTGGMLPALYFWLLDAGKYGLGILGDYWCEEVNYVSRVEMVEEMLLDQPLGTKKKQLITEEVRGYYGSKVFNIRPYDYFPDTRVPLWKCQEGEFVSWHQEKNWLQLLRAEDAGVMVNVDILKRKQMSGGDTGRIAGSPRVDLPNDNTNILGTSDLTDTGQYGLLTMVADIVPSQMGLSPVNVPEKWVFTCGLTAGKGAMSTSTTGNAEVVVGVRPLGCDHNKFPVSCLEAEPEAYGLGSRGIPEVMKPMQDTMDWLINSHMYNVRKTMNNQFLVDPSKIVVSDLSDPMAGGAIRLRPSAYGTDVNTIMKQLAVVDLTKGHLGDMAMFDQFAQKALGINEQIMGQANTGGRKTAQEVRTSSTFGINRQKTVAEFFSMMGFDPLSMRLVQNSQQYFDAPMKLRMVGDLIQEAGPKFLQVTPEDIAGFFDFVPVDGTMPIDRFQMASLWQQMFGQISRIPQIASTYDLGRIFGWVAQLAGLKSIHRFKIQIMQPGQQMPSNVVPLPTASRDITRTPEVGQIPQLGTTG